MSYEARLDEGVLVLKDEPVSLFNEYLLDILYRLNRELGEPLTYEDIYEKIDDAEEVAIELLGNNGATDPDITREGSVVYLWNSMTSYSFYETCIKFLNDNSHLFRGGYLLFAGEDFTDWGFFYNETTHIFEECIPKQIYANNKGLSYDVSKLNEKYKEYKK